ncbi:hypothetical protein E4U23_004574 [Claviceps purpurea]|nr:hypothetical protein E4U23_004574 [Claviceps purpurea]
MVKILSIFLATLAAFSPVAQAGDCTPGVSYCGSTLQRYGFPGAGKLNPDDLYNCVSPKKVRRSRFTTSNLTMVKILSIFLATLATIGPVAQADACIRGRRYCGSTLQRYGNEPLLNDQTDARLDH